MPACKGRATLSVLMRFAVAEAASLCCRVAVVDSREGFCVVEACSVAADKWASKTVVADQWLVGVSEGDRWGRAYSSGE
eukprot:1339916-Pleurochrysis_carterae.AAC.1